ncbi:MAG TPA: ATP-binding protein, partial [Chitinophagaceae bacterium]|nr:ATP-binding protein [Chitinophagaceae bacterium]
MDEFSPFDTKKNVLRLNLFLGFCISITGIGMVFHAVNELLVSALVNLLGTAILVLAFYMNKDGKHEHAKWIAISAINLHQLSISYVEGIKSGQYLLVFPLLLALIFVIDLKKNLNELVITSIVTLLSMAFIFILAPYVNTLQNISNGTYSGLFASNLATSLLLTTVFSYIILKTMGRHEDKILDEKKLTDTIYDTSLDAVFIVDVADLMIMDCNKRALSVFGHQDKNALIKQPVQHLLGQPMLEHIMNLNSTEFDRRAAWYGNMDFERAKDELFYAYVNIVPFHHQNNHYCKISILDITEIKVAEFEILKAKERAEKAAKVKARFLSNMSHELRTPLNAIIGTSNILLQEEYLPSQKESFTVLQNSSEHMLQLVNDILDLSKLEAGKMELEKIPFNLKQFMAKVSSSFKGRNPQISFVVDVDPQLDIEIISDETRLHQILNNLLSNAWKFTQSGTITVTAKAESEPNQEVTVRFSVADTGIGIQPNKLKQIFDSFTQADAETTRKYGGTGLGLAICKYLVHKMGGELQVESEVDKGSCFYFSLNFNVNAKKGYVNEASLKQLNGLDGLRVL